ncbi:flagellar motor stator protein [Candidatus Campylobacter infans]|uniref:Flagellar motor stator protein n=1 Tax=Candidatus Campylobacter infans TaxID=2561898 RepID=A0A7H9CII8_9BACT|nr:flagellar motor stator protein MotA [Candidatus Campylobacter infans]KAF0589936.1 MAG: flagellar motor stator protein [Candidatus Campylobacter infans]QLI05937.1 flagellar motor stator protein [Candidatus Campylobacter infans]
MDLATILGMVLSITSISVGDILEGGNPIHVIHLSSFLIVIPTAMMASMTATNKRYVGPAFKELGIVFKGAGVDLNKRIEELVSYSTIARKDGILALEQKAQGVENEFLKSGLSMLVDGQPIDEVRENLELELETTENYYHECAHFWLRTGESCPTFGLVGAVMGLMLALQLLDNPQAMAAGIAGAFTATVTGIMGAYAFFGPWGNKLMNNAKDLIKERELIIEALVGIAEGANPRNLEAKLFNFLEKSQPRTSQFK